MATLIIDEGEPSIAAQERNLVPSDSRLGRRRVTCKHLRSGLEANLALMPMVSPSGGASPLKSKSGVQEFLMKHTSEMCLCEDEIRRLFFWQRA